MVFDLPLLLLFLVFYCFVVIVTGFIVTVSIAMFPSLSSISLMFLLPLDLIFLYLNRLSAFLYGHPYSHLHCLDNQHRFTLLYICKKWLSKIFTNLWTCKNLVLHSVRFVAKRGL